MTDSIAAAKLAIYIILVQPATYCLFKHGKTGFFGWLYVQIFCVLRIATGGIGLHGASSTGSLIVNSIGLSPLMLAASGILHEARRATNPRLNRRLDIVLEVKYHGLVGAAMALIIVAVTNSQDGDSKTLLTAASALMALAWLLLVIWALWSLGKAQGLSTSKRIPSFHGGRVLLYAVFLALPLLGLRLAYAITYLQLQISHPKSGFLTSKAIQICLGMIPEIVVTVIFLFVGVKTRSLKHDIAKLHYSQPDDESHEMQR